MCCLSFGACVCPPHSISTIFSLSAFYFCYFLSFCPRRARCFLWIFLLSEQNIDITQTIEILTEYICVHKHSTANMPQNPKNHFESSRYKSRISFCITKYNCSQDFLAKTKKQIKHGKVWTVLERFAIFVAHCQFSSFSFHLNSSSGIKKTCEHFSSTLHWNSKRPANIITFSIDVYT